VDIAWFRDLIICIFGISATVVVLTLAILAVMCYRRVRPILDSVKATTRTVENLSSTVEAEVAKPLSQVAAFVQGIRQAVGFVKEFRTRREE
jgi:hypothetical protein